jgi:hypothetical protein
MKDGPIICPLCGLESPDDHRFCRACGTNVADVRRALAGEIASEQEIEEAGRRARLRVVRGISFVVLAAGFGKLFFALLIAAFGLGVVGLLELLGLSLLALLPVAFLGLAVRDFLTAYELRRNPRARVAGAGAESTDLLKSASPFALPEPTSSVIDDITRPLDREARERNNANRDPSPR